MKNVKRSKKAELSREDKHHIITLAVMMFIVLVVMPIWSFTYLGMEFRHMPLGEALLYGLIIYLLCCGVFLGTVVLLYGLFELIRRVARATYIYAKYQYYCAGAYLARKQFIRSVSTGRKPNRSSSR